MAENRRFMNFFISRYVNHTDIGIINMYIHDTRGAGGTGVDRWELGGFAPLIFDPD